ncbi:MAG: Rid family detoxifying hydrolase [Pseudomonadota bacterium]
MIEMIETDRAAAAAGHYSQAVKANGFIFVATQLPIDPENPEQEKGNVQDQTRQVLSNIIEIVRAAGGEISSICRISIYVSKTEHWGDVDEMYKEMLGNHKPARGVLEIPNIRKGYDVSMEAIATII